MNSTVTQCTPKSKYFPIECVTNANGLPVLQLWPTNVLLVRVCFIYLFMFEVVGPLVIITDTHTHMGSDIRWRSILIDLKKKKKHFFIFVKSKSQNKNRNRDDLLNVSHHEENKASHTTNSCLLSYSVDGNVAIHKSILLLFCVWISRIAHNTQHARIIRFDVTTAIAKTKLKWSKSNVYERTLCTQREWNPYQKQRTLCVWLIYKHNTAIHIKARSYRIRWLDEDIVNVYMCVKTKNDNTNSCDSVSDSNCNTNENHTFDFLAPWRVP